jgi:hypothetical protein
VFVTAELTVAAAEVERAEETAGAAPTEVTSEMSAVERAGLYHRGGRLFITTRILVVDLLASRVRPLLIARTRRLHALQAWAVPDEGEPLEREPAFPKRHDSLSWHTPEGLLQRFGLRRCRSSPLCLLARKTSAQGVQDCVCSVVGRPSALWAVPRPYSSPCSANATPHLPPLPGSLN